MGKDLANPMAMILACARGAAATRRAAGVAGAERASRAIYEGVLETTAGGVKTVDLGGHATTTEFTDAVVEQGPRPRSTSGRRSARRSGRAAGSAARDAALGVAGGGAARRRR